ncbi:MAG: sodium:calcium antiporter, partial [Acidobacteriota bacterium]
SKVNQWTLLVGTIPLVYSFGLGRPGALPLVQLQRHELWLTSAQSLMAVALLVNLKLSWHGAVSLFVLFCVQLVYPPIHMPISAVYALGAAGLIWRDRGHYRPLIRSLLRV